MTESEKRLKEFDYKYESWVIIFNDLHRRAKRIKQMIGRKKSERDELVKQVAIDRQRGAMAD